MTKLDRQLTSITCRHEVARQAVWFLVAAGFRGRGFSFAQTVGEVQRFDDRRPGDAHDSSYAAENRIVGANGEDVGKREKGDGVSEPV